MKKMTWKELQDSGLLWWINRILHTFGVAIVISQNSDGTINEVYPAEVEYRGFSLESEERGYEKVDSFIKKKYEKK
jgi:hypothetical protein